MALYLVQAIYRGLKKCSLISRNLEKNKLFGGRLSAVTWKYSS